MVQTMQTGGPSSAKIELADGVDAKNEKCAEQEVKFERQDKEKMEMDNLWLQVKGEIKEEIEQEEQQEQTCKSSSLDDLTRKEIMMKEEMEEEPKHDEAFESLKPSLTTLKLQRRRGKLRRATRLRIVKTEVSQSPSRLPSAGA